MIADAAFPRLSPTNHQITSPATAAYNCIAWAAGDSGRWWQPGRYWVPLDWPKEETGPGALESLFHSLGYVDCAGDAGLDTGFEKVALYGYGLRYTHAARQLSSGRWTSKLGQAEDIEHNTPDDVAGGVYGEVMQIMRRAVPAVGESA